MTRPERFMVFDVESIGLHGEGFAVGWVEIDRDGREQGYGCVACASSRAAGSDSGRHWVQQNVMPVLGDETTWVETPQDVRDIFWRCWLTAKSRGAALVADCAWPVEARFLAACVDDSPEAREWEGPYPLLEAAAVLGLAGFDPSGTYARKTYECPPHNPLADARQSARLFIEALDAIGGLNW